MIDWRNAHFLITCVGMADAWMWSFDADGKWSIVHGTPGAGLVPFRIDGAGPALPSDRGTAASWQRSRARAASGRRSHFRQLAAP
jgi:hypothetical protein